MSRDDSTREMVGALTGYLQGTESEGYLESFLSVTVDTLRRTSTTRGNEPPNSPSLGEYKCNKILQEIHFQI